MQRTTYSYRVRQPHAHQQRDCVDVNFHLSSLGSHQKKETMKNKKSTAFIYRFSLFIVSLKERIDFYMNRYEA